MNTRCVVVMDNERKGSNDFVAVLANDKCDATMYFNADAVTLGMAFRLIADQFIKSMDELDDVDKKTVCDAIKMPRLLEAYL